MFSERISSTKIIHRRCAFLYLILSHLVFGDYTCKHISITHLTLNDIKHICLLMNCATLMALPHFGHLWVTLYFLVFSTHASRTKIHLLLPFEIRRLPRLY